MCTYADYIEKKGIEKGLKLVEEQALEFGVTMGKIYIFASLVNDGDITLERAAEKLQMTIPEFKKIVKEYGYSLMI